ASRVDDDLLLAVDDGEEAVLVQLADVARVEPAVRVDRLGGLRGIVPVAEHDAVAAAQHLAVVAELDLDPGRGWADGSDPHLARTVDSPEAARLGHTPKLRQLDPD